MNGTTSLAEIPTAGSFVPSVLQNSAQSTFIAGSPRGFGPSGGFQGQQSSSSAQASSRPGRHGADRRAQVHRSRSRRPSRPALAAARGRPTRRCPGLVAGARPAVRSRSPRIGQARHRSLLQRSSRPRPRPPRGESTAPAGRHYLGGASCARQHGRGHGSATIRAFSFSAWATARSATTQPVRSWSMPPQRRGAPAAPSARRRHHRPEPCCRTSKMLRRHRRTRPSSTRRPAIRVFEARP